MNKPVPLLIFVVMIFLQAPLLVLADNPPLPPGLSGNNVVFDHEEPAQDTTGVFTGFWEARLGGRLQDDPTQDQATLAETRLQISYERMGESIGFTMVADLVYDDLVDNSELDLEAGEGWLDLRELNALVHPGDNLDIKLGRQILTWGTGDLVFINDLFPKDFQSFFLGRNDEYLKAPSDAIKFSLYNEAANIDLVYTPRFDADRYIDGSRLSFYGNAQGQLVGKQDIVQAEQPDEAFEDDEIALRIYRNLAGYELAAYAYSGFWKSPAGLEPVSGQATFPELNVYGLSVRGVAAGGIGYSEAGYYDSREDQEGKDPTIRNSELRILFGYEWEALRDLQLGIQYYVEHMMDYDNYIQSLPTASIPVDENHQLITLRITQLALNQNLRLSLFTFYSPSDEDGYLKPGLTYRINDAWVTEAGINWFFGKQTNSFFGQLENNSNLFVSIRYGFEA